MGPVKTYHEKYPAVSFKLGDVQLAIDSRTLGATPENSSRADAIRVMVARYDQVCSSSAPRLTVEAWQLCAEALPMDVLRASHDYGRFVWASIDDEIRQRQLDKKWKINGVALVEQVRAFSQGELLGFIDVLERSSICRSRGQAFEYPCDLGEIRVPPAAVKPAGKKTKGASKRG